MEKELYTLKEVAEILRMKWSWVTRMVKEGKIKTVPMGGKSRLVSKKELNNLIKNGVK